MTYRNLPQMHRCQSERLGPRVAIRYKRHGLYHDVNWSQYRADALACAAALVDSGIKPGDRVGLLSENRVDWLIADMGIMTAGAVNNPPHAPLTAAQVLYQFDDAGVRWIIVSNQAQLDKVLQVRKQLTNVQGIVAFDSGLKGDGVESWGAFLQRGRRALEKLGKEMQKREAELGTDDLATIMYTSGTTGNPKGVMLTHGNLVSNVCAALEVAPVGIDELTLCWLPLSHIYGRTVDHYKSIAAGSPLGLGESAETVVENMAELQPSHISCVPRFYEKLLAAVGTSDMQATSMKLKAIFGPKMAWCGSGGAPLPPAVEEVLHAAGLPILPGYGLTESSPVITFNRKGASKPGTVGKAIPGVEVKIAPDGEILSRGPHIMKGYWNNPEATAEALKDGWLYTGDLGSIDEEGFLKITGRKKELLVLSNGKKVVPTHIEGLLLSDECVDQVAVHGEGRNYLTALIVPQWDNLRRALRAAGTGVDGESEEVLARSPGVQSLYRRRVDAALKDVSNSEQVKKFIVLSKPFTVANDEITVSLKLRRNVVFAKYQKELDALYKE